MPDQTNAMTEILSMEWLEQLDDGSYELSVLKLTQETFGSQPVFALFQTDARRNRPELIIVHEDSLGFNADPHLTHKIDYSDNKLIFPTNLGGQLTPFMDRFLLIRLEEDCLVIHPASG